MSGLGKSTPLVTVSGPAAIKRQVAVPAGNNHPLASPLAAAPLLKLNTPNVDATQAMHAPAANAVQRSPAQPNRVMPGQPQTKILPTVASPTKSLDALADAFLSEPSYRTEQLQLPPLLRPSPLPREDGIHRLRTLVERRAWGDVLKISTTMLTSEKEVHSAVYASLLVTTPSGAAASLVENTPMAIRQETVEIMTLQCHALLKLRRYADLVAEVERWNFLTFNDATAQSPEWLSWSLHILAGQAQQYAEHVERPSDILFELRERIPKEESFWLINVDNALTNMFLRDGEVRLALGSLDRMMDLLPNAVRQEVQSKFVDAPNKDQLESVLTAAYKCEILSRQGRALLQVGALPQVAQIFEFATTMWDGIKSNNTIPTELQNLNAVRIIPCQMEINAGLFNFSKNNYEEALQSFTSAMDILRSFGGDLTSKYDVDDWMGSGVATCYEPNVIYSECLNNMSLCCLYTCQMSNAVSYLEGLVREDPTAFLNERVAFNLCTLYELGADSTTSARKKRVLQLIAKRFFLHDVGPESFRVT